MEQYYRELGLEPGADQAEIKRAYFKLVRQFPPEKDPERFQQIRKAYEQLTLTDSSQTGPQFAPLEAPLAVSMMKQITEARESGDDELFRDICQEAWNSFPEKIQFLYLLVIAQRQCGNTGKAVKNAAELVKREPENQWFWRELAISYMERGYTQKAFPAFEKAYGLGNRDNDFILLYAEECRSYGESDTGCRILREMLASPETWAKEDLPEYMEAFAELFLMAATEDGSFFQEIGDDFLSVLEKQGKNMGDYLPAFAMMLDRLSENPSWEMPELKKCQEIVLQMKTYAESAKEQGFFDAANDGVLSEILAKEDRFDETMHMCVEALWYYPNDGMQDDRTMRFVQTDAKLCMIMEREAILPQAEILKKDYAEVYQAVQPFLEKLESGENLDLLKEQLLKDYKRMYLDYSEAHFAEKYPEEIKKLSGTVFYDGDEPFVRPGRKIGRNDPCPCGSGKKYKQCCMRKQGNL